MKFLGREAPHEASGVLRAKRAANGEAEMDPLPQNSLAIACDDGVGTYVQVCWAKNALFEVHQLAQAHV